MTSTTPRTFAAFFQVIMFYLNATQRLRIGRTAYVLTVVGLLALSGCSHTPEVTDQNVRVIDDVGLVELLERDAGVVLVDVRPDYKYRLGHLPGAVNIPLPDLKYTDSRLAGAKHVVVYGDKPGNALSHAAAKKLLAGGKVAVSDFRGGCEAWLAANRELVTVD